MLILKQQNNHTDKHKIKLVAFINIFFTRVAKGFNFSIQDTLLSKTCFISKKGGSTIIGSSLLMPSHCQWMCIAVSQNLKTLNNLVKHVLNSNIIKLGMWNDILKLTVFFRAFLKDLRCSRHCKLAFSKWII